MADSKNRFVFRNSNIPKEYWTMTPEQKREWVKQFLQTFSGNEEVKKRSQGNSE